MTTLFNQRIQLGLTAVGILLVACAGSPAFSEESPAMIGHKQQVVELLKSIETGNPKPLIYISPNKYIQHNLAVADGLIGVKAFLQSIPKGSAKVQMVST